MKKLDFYTMQSKNKKPAAVLVSGYTDGTFNYYKNDRGYWWAIHPGTGLAVTNCFCSSRKTAAENAHDPFVLEKLKNLMDRDSGKEMVNRFNKLIQEEKQC